MNVYVYRNYLRKLTSCLHIANAINGINLVQIFIRSEDIGWMGFLEVVLSNLMLRGLFNINIYFCDCL